MSEQRLTEDQPQVSPDSLKQLLTTVAALPRSWVVLMGFVAVASAVKVRSDENGATNWDVSIGSLTLIALALIWLPAALQYLALAGGSISAAGVHAATSGLLSAPETLIGDLAELRAKSEKIGQEVPGSHSTVQQMSTAIDDIATRYLPSDDVLNEEILNRYAREYERLRRTTEAGPVRTQRMDQLANEIRIRATAAPDTARRAAPGYLRSPRPGDRVVGLALIEGAPTTDVFEDVLRIFSTSASAFEQFHSLHTLLALTPALTQDQRNEAIRMVETERSDPRGVGLMNDAAIPWLIDELLGELRR